MALHMFMVRESSLSVQEASALLVQAWQTSSENVSSLPPVNPMRNLHLLWLFGC